MIRVDSRVDECTLLRNVAPSDVTINFEIESLDIQHLPHGADHYITVILICLNRLTENEQARGENNSNNEEFSDNRDHRGLGGRNHRAWPILRREKD